MAAKIANSGNLSKFRSRTGYKEHEKYNHIPLIIQTQHLLQETTAYLKIADEEQVFKEFGKSIANLKIDVRLRINKAKDEITQKAYKILKRENAFEAMKYLCSIQKRQALIINPLFKVLETHEINCTELDTEIKNIQQYVTNLQDNQTPEALFPILLSTLKIFGRLENSRKLNNMFKEFIQRQLKNGNI